MVFNIGFDIKKIILNSVIISIEIVAKFLCIRSQIVVTYNNKSARYHTPGC
ncbi:hypothetical protein ACF0H5_000047 [Mactra antiquata]